MRIEKITLIHLKVPLKKPFFSAGKLFREKDFLLLKVISGNAVGWGEASPETVSFDELMLDYKRNLVPFALQMPFDAIEDFSHSLSVMKASPEARAGLEMAAGNLLAQIENSDFGGAVAKQDMRSFSIARILESGEESEINQALESASKTDNAQVVLKINPENIKTITLVLRNFGEKIKFTLDAEGSFTKENIEEINRLSEFPVQLLIDPLRDEQWPEIGQLKENWKIPVAIKNACTDILELEKICESSFIDAVCIDPWRVGGLTTAARYLTVASEFNKKTYIFSQLHLDIGITEALVLLSYYMKDGLIFMTIPEEVFGTKLVSDSLLQFQGNLARLPATARIHFNGLENQLDRFRVTEEEYW